MNIRILILWAVVGVTQTSIAADAERDEPPILVVVRHETTFDLSRLIDSANREFVRRRIAEYKLYAKGNDDPRARIHQEVRAWEKGLAELKPTGKVLPGAAHVTIFEEPGSLVVAYFDNSRMDHFVCSFSKVDYAPLAESAQPRRKAANLTQKSLIIE